MTDYTQKAVRGGVISFVFLGISAFAALFIRIVLARNLSVNDFGLFYAVLAFVGMFTFLRDIGLSEALVRFIPGFIHRKLLGRIKGLVYLVFSVQTVLGTAFFTAFIIAAPYLAQHYFKSQVAVDLLVILGLGFLLGGIIETMALAFNATHNQFYQTSMESAYLLSVLGISVLLLSLGLGIRAPAFAYVIGSIPIIVIYFALLRFRAFPFFRTTKLSLTATHIKEYLRYSLALVPGSAAVAFLHVKISILLLTYFKGLYLVGLFTAAVTVSQMLRLIRTAVQYVIFPMSSELWEKGKKQYLADGIALAFKYVLIIGLPTVGIIFAFPKEFLRVLFGQEYVAAAGILQILSFAMLALVYANTIAVVFMGIGKSNLSTKQFYVAGLINLLVALALIPPFGGHGAAIALLAAFLWASVYGVRKLNKYVAIKVPWKEGFRTLISCGFFLGSIFLFKRVLEFPTLVEIVLSLAGSIPIYVGSLFALRVVRVEEVRNIVSSLIGSRK